MADVSKLRANINGVFETYNVKDSVAREKAPVIVESSQGNPVTFEDGSDEYALRTLEVEFEPSQDLHGQDSPNPYNNYCPIIGRESLKVERTGKNLFDIAEYLEAGATEIVEEYPDTYTGYKQRFFFKNGGNCYTTPEAEGLIPRIPYGVLTISYYKYETGSDRVCFHYTDAEAWVSVSGVITTAGFISYTSSATRICDGVGLSTSQGPTAAFKMGMLQIEKGSSATEYARYNHQQADFAFEETIYGGKLNALAGILFRDWYCTVVDGVTRKATALTLMPDTSDFVNVRGKYRVTLIDLNNDIMYNTPSHFKCTHFKWNTYTARRLTNPDEITFATSGRIVYWFSSTFTTLDEFNNYLAEQNSNGTPVMLVYKRPASDVISIDSCKMNTVFGFNEIKSDAGTVSVDYAADTKLYISKKIAEAISP